MNKATLNVGLARTKIDRNIYGHFAEHLGRCIYEGVWVGPDSSIPNTRGIRNDVVQALRRIKIPVLRWPGGCFADEYHWEDGIGPRESRPTMINTHWGGVTENNHFGTHEFLDLCAQLGCEPYICGNVGSGTVREMAQWVEYLNFGGKSPMADLRRENGREEPWGVTYWGVGNENWGCGGLMTADYYADQYRQYSLYCRNYEGRKLYKIACGPRDDDEYWTDVLMKKAGRLINGRSYMDGLALHYYTSIYENGRKRVGQATDFTEAEWIEILRKGLHMEDLIRRHSTIMDRYDPEKRVALIVDEWGTWYKVEPGTNPGFLYQQNAMRDALVAATSLDIFNRHADRVRMANIAQTINVLQAVVLTDKEKMVLTPTFHVYEMYTVHHDATLVPVDLSSEKYEHDGVEIPALSASASVDAGGKLHLTMSNLNPHRDLDVQLRVHGRSCEAVSGTVLSGDAMNAHNTFEDPERVRPRDFDGAKVKDGGLAVTVPKMSVIALEVT